MGDKIGRVVDYETLRNQGERVETMDKIEIYKMGEKNYAHFPGTGNIRLWEEVKIMTAEELKTVKGNNQDD